MQRGRGKSKNIKNGIKAAILYVETTHSDWSANRIREYLLGNLARFNLEKPDIPVVRSIYNVIERNQSALTGMQVVVSSEKFKRLEFPWHMGLIAERDEEGHIKHPDYQVSAEALSYILIVQKYAENNTDIFGRQHEPVSIRQALWVSRLCGAISPNPKAMKKDTQKMLYSIAHYLYQWSEAYATRERICELSDTPINTNLLDKSLREGGEPITVDKTTITFYRKDQSFYIDTIDENLLKQMEQMKKDGEA